MIIDNADRYTQKKLFCYGGDNQKEPALIFN